MNLEQAILDRLEKRNAQIAQLQSMVHALERAADSQREHAILERGRLLEENKKLAAQVADRYQIVTDLHDLYNQRISARDDSLTAAERLCKSLNDEITKRDHELRAHEKELAEQREEIRKLMDGHAEDMKAQAELQGKYESILTKTTDLGSYAMTIGRKEGEPLEMFMERQALRLAALEAAITAAKCDELAKATARIKPLEALYKTLKGWQENDHIIGYGLTIDTAINKATEALSQLTA